MAAVARIVSVRLALAALALGPLAGARPTRAQAPPGDPAIGRALAVQLCTGCHVVEAAQPRAPTLQPPAPSFSAIAGRPGVTASALEHFLATTHASVGQQHGMPNLDLADFQLPPLVAYVLSQKGRANAAAPPPREAPQDPLYDRVLRNSQAPTPRSLDALK